MIIKYVRITRLITSDEIYDKDVEHVPHNAQKRKKKRLRYEDKMAHTGWPYGSKM